MTESRCKVPRQERVVENRWPYKLKLSKNVKRHLERVFWDAGWTDAGQGWEGTDGALPSVRLRRELARHHVAPFPEK